MEERSEGRVPDIDCDEREREVTRWEVSQETPFHVQ